MAKRKPRWYDSLPECSSCPQCGSEERFWPDLGLTKSPLKAPYCECADCLYNHPENPPVQYRLKKED